MKPNALPARTEARQEPRSTLPVLSPSPAAPRAVAATQGREDDFLEPLRGKPVRVAGTFGGEWHGLLLGVTKFEIRLELADESKVVILKHAIASVAEEVRR